MNKVGLFICFLLAISFTKSEEIDGIDVDEVYGKLIIITKGMAKTAEYKCSNTLNNKKDEILPVVKDAVRNLKNTEEISNILGTLAVKLFKTGVLNDCNVINIISFVSNILKPDGIRNLGYNIKNNVNPLSGLLQEYFQASDKERKLFVLGQIIRIITGVSLE